MEIDLFLYAYLGFSLCVGMFLIVYALLGLRDDSKPAKLRITRNPSVFVVDNITED